MAFNEEVSTVQIENRKKRLDHIFFWDVGGSRSQGICPFSSLFPPFSYQLGCGRQSREPKQLWSWAIAAVPVKNSVSIYNLDISSDYYCSGFILLKISNQKERLNAIPPPSISTIIELSNFNDTAAPKKCKIKAGAPQHGTRRELAQITIDAHRYSNGSMLMSQLVILSQPARMV